MCSRSNVLDPDPMYGRAAPDLALKSEDQRGFPSGSLETNMADHAEILANFLAITDAPEAAALNTLEACDWKLDDAVNLFFASGDAQGTSSAEQWVERSPHLLQNRALHAEARNICSHRRPCWGLRGGQRHGESRRRHP